MVLQAEAEQTIKRYANQQQFALLKKFKQRGTLGEKQLTTDLWLTEQQARELGYDALPGQDFLLSPTEPRTTTTKWGKTEQNLYGYIPTPQSAEQPTIEPISNIPPGESDLLFLTRIFPSTSIEESSQHIINLIENDPQQLVKEITAVGRNADTEQLLKALDLSDAEVDNLFRFGNIPSQGQDYIYTDMVGNVPVRKLGNLLPNGTVVVNDQVIGAVDLSTGKFQSINEIRKQASPSDEQKREQLRLGGVSEDEIGKIIGLSNMDLSAEEWLDKYKSINPSFSKSLMYGVTTRSIASGLGGILQAGGGIAGRFKQETIEKNLKDVGEVLQSSSPEMIQWTGPATLVDPRFWQTTVTSTLTYSMALIPVSVAVAYAGTATAGAIGLGAFGTGVMTLLFGSVGNAMSEAALESGDTWNRAKQMGFSDEDAAKASDSVFWKNTALLTAMNIPEFAFAFGFNPFKGALSRMATSGLVKIGRYGVPVLTEGGQEYYQDIYTRQALGQPVVWDNEAKLAVILGAIIGVGIGAGGNAFTSIQERTKANLTPDLQTVFDTARTDALNQGLSEQAAELKALDAIAETPEGKKIVKDAATIIQKQEQMATLKSTDKAEEMAAKTILQKQISEIQTESISEREARRKITPVTPEVTKLPVLEGTPEFKKFVTDVVNDFSQNKVSYQEELQSLIPDIKIESIELTGSYASQGKPTEDSDIDILVRYSGAMSEEAIATALAGKVQGFGGAFDIVPQKATPQAEVTPPVTEPGQPEAGVQQGMMGVPSQEVRPQGKGRVTQISMEEQLKLQQAREQAAAESPEAQRAVEIQAEIEGLRESLQQDPVAQFRFKLGGKNVGLESVISIREQSVPDKIGAKTASALNPGKTFTQSVPRDVAFDTLSKEFNMTPDEIANRIEQIRADKRRITELEGEARTIVTPAVTPTTEAEKVAPELAPSEVTPPPNPPSNDIPLNTNPEPNEPTSAQGNIIGLRTINQGLTKTEVAGNFLKRMVNAVGRTLGMSQMIEADPIANAAMRERDRVLVTVESQANILGTKWATELERVFKFDKQGRITNLAGVDTDIVGAPTIQDVAARLPNYIDALTKEQVDVLRGLREAIAPYRQLLEEQGIEIPYRLDVMQGGFYLPRGRAALEGADQPIKIGGGRRGVRKGFERPAFFGSQAAGIEEGYEYSEIRQTLTSYSYDAGTRATNTYIANYFKTLNDETGQLIGETTKMRMLRQNPEIAKVVDEIKDNLNKLKSNIGALTQRQMDVIELWQNDHEFGDIDTLLNGLETMRGGRPALVLPELRALYEQNLETLKALRPEYNKAMRRAQTTPRDQGVIILPELAGRTYPNEIANAVNKVLKTEGETIGRLSPILNVINAYNNFYRGVRATLDDSIVAIQGLLGMYGDPKAYTGAFKLHLASWAHDNVLGAWVNDFDASRKSAGRLTTTEMAEHGLHFAGAEGTEFSLGIGTKIGELPGIKQANRAFSNFGDVMRALWADHSIETEMAKGRTLEQLKESGDLDRIMNIANSMTGWSTKKAFGSLGDLVLFAPRFLQARLEVVTKAAMGLRPNATIDQRIARNAIVKMIAFGTLLTMAANAVQGEPTDFEPLRKDKDGKWRRNAKFMRVKFGGHYYSLFGTWDSLLGMFINIGTGRPLAAVRSMSSGVVANTWDIITGKDYNYKATTDTPAHFGQWILSSFVPFGISQAGAGATQMWGGIVDGETSDVVSGGINVAAELFGVKSFPEEDWDAILNQVGLRQFDIVDVEKDALLSTEIPIMNWQNAVQIISGTSAFRSYPSEEIAVSPDFPRQVQAVAQTMILRDKYSGLRNWVLISLDPEKLEAYRTQWLTREKLVNAGDKAEYTVKGELQLDGRRKDVTYRGEDALKKYDELFGDAKFGNMAQTEYVLLQDYFSLNSKKSQQDFVKLHPELKANPRNDWLMNPANAKDVALLALSGRGGIFTKESYNEMMNWLKELDIPPTAIPPMEQEKNPFFQLPKESVDNYIELQNLMSQEGTAWNSWESQLIYAKDDKLREFMGYDPVETPIASLELKTEKTYRDIYNKLNDADYLKTLDDEVKDANGLTEKDKYIADLKSTKIGDQTYTDIDRRIEAIENEGDPALWVERGKVIDEFNAGSSEAMYWLLQHPDVHKWAVEQELLTDDGSDWNKNVIALNVEMNTLDPDSDRYKLLSRYKDAYSDGFTRVDEYANYYNLSRSGYRQERYLLEHPEFAVEMKAIKGIELPDYVPPEEYDILLEKADKTPEDLLRIKAYDKRVPENQLDSYVSYYSLAKPTDWQRQTGTSLWYEDDWWMMEHPDFYKNVYVGILGNERKDYRLVPTRQVFSKYLDYLNLPEGKWRDDFRFANKDLDDWGQQKFGWIDIDEKKRREELTPLERAKESTWEQEQEWKKRLKEIEEILEGVK
uniref:Uncharacterized protein n=1 Tax=viral metagenome TaxID=1070528 RepID=A0A6H1ZL88_9ZZZZ